MKPIKFPQSTGTLTRPPSMTDEECAPLPVHMCVNQDSIISCWRPSWRERLAVVFGCPVWLWVIGTGGRHPPVAIEVENPFAEPPHDD
jgi:hypothetical protein